MGFNLDECRELVALFNDPARHSADVKARTLQKVAEIERHISELGEMRQRLLALADQCPGDEGRSAPSSTTWRVLSSGDCGQITRTPGCPSACGTTRCFGAMKDRVLESWCRLRRADFKEEVL